MKVSNTNKHYMQAMAIMAAFIGENVSIMEMPRCLGKPRKTSNRKPHQGAQECARRVRQIAKGMIKGK